MSKMKYGLTSAQVAENKQKYGDNKLSVKESATLLEMFIDSLKDPWILILIAALVVKVIFNVYSMNSGIGEVNWWESISLAVAILLSSGVSTFSTYKNEKEFNSLQAEASKILVKVYRDGELHQVNIDEITYGDAILLQSGDKVPVDGIILEGTCKVNQATLNGESEDATKIALGDNPEPDSTDLFTELKIFRGTVVTSGEVIMKATVLGDNTVMGSINTALQEDTKKSPSAEKLEKLAKQIGVMGYSAAGAYTLIVLAQTLIQGQSHNWVPFIIELVMYAVTIVIMAVPEGLPMMLAMVSSMNSGRLLKENILVRHSDSIETAGYVNILFSDKTGTITEGTLSVVDLIQPDGTITTAETWTSLNDNFVNEVVNGVGLNNDALLSEGKAIGSNATDRALLEFLIKSNKHEIDRDVITEKEQFDSAKKYAAVSTKDGARYIKGAPEFILKDVKYYLTTSGEKKEFTKDLFSKLEEMSIAQAERAMRILAIVKEIDGEQTFITGVCIRDNVRQGMSTTVDNLHKAGVQVIMVTGDRKETAIAIAKEAHIYKDGDIALTNAELAELSDDEVKEILPKLKVVSRALPLDKKRLVNLAQELDLVAGMTGDGVNDSPSLKAADVGFSMGDGTATAQEASDIVILNNSLSSIEKAILFGRTMTLSVKKFIIFQLTVNVATIFLSLLGPIFGFHEPFTIIQILWINLVMDTFAALMFGGEPPLSRYMEEKPVHRKDSILTVYMKSAIGTAALFATLGCLFILTNAFGSHKLLELHNHQEVGTFMFSFFIYTILFNSLNTRSTGFNLFEHIKDNPKFIYVLATIMVVQTLIIQFGGVVFSTVPMDLKHYMLALGMAFLVIPFDFIRKALTKK